MTETPDTSVTERVARAIARATALTAYPDMPEDELAEVADVFALKCMPEARAAISSMPALEENARLREALEAIVCMNRTSHCPCDEWVETDPACDGMYAKIARAALKEGASR